MVRDLVLSARKFPLAWDHFWFSPLSTRVVARVRIAIGVAAAFHFFMFLFWVPQWLSGDGWFNLETGRYLIGEGIPGTGSQYRWSLLFRATHPGAALAVCVVGLLTSIATATGIGSRIAPLMAWVCLITIHHRAPWLSMPGELLLAAGLLYLVIDTGRTAWSILPKRDDVAQRVSANLAWRCIQIHFLLWMMFSITSMLQYGIWWNGTAVAVLSEQFNGWMGVIPTASRWGQAIAHAMIIFQVVALLTLGRASTVSVGLVATWMFAVCVAIFAGDWLYALTILAMSVSFVPFPSNCTSPPSTP
jgi:hypothetical protein